MQVKKNFPLTQAQIGQDVRLVKINGNKQVTHRLVELGMTPGVALRVLQDAGGPLLLAVRDISYDASILLIYTVVFIAISAFQFVRKDIST